MMNNENAISPLYPRIREYAYIAQNGEFTFCFSCKENNAICPDCGNEICVFCQDECDECGGSMF